MSEPGAVAMGSNNSVKLDDPVATALGSDTDSERRARVNVPLRSKGISKLQGELIRYERGPLENLRQTNAAKVISY